jgi:hypothetical protein
MNDSADIDSGDPVEFAGWQVRDRADRQQPRRVDEDVRRAGFSPDGSESFFNGVIVANIYGDRVAGASAAPNRCGDTLGGGLVAIGDNDDAAFHCQCAGNGFANAGAAAGDECDAPIEIEVHFVTFRSLRGYAALRTF